MQSLKSPSTKALQRAVWLALAVLGVVVLAFAGYYVWDRFVHLDDQSPLELSMGHIEQAVRDDPKNADARVALAETYLAAGQNQNALDQVSQVLALYPDNPGALLIAGIANVRLNQPQAAVAPLESFVAQRKDQPMALSDTVLEAAYYFLGESYVKLDRQAEAIEALEAALLISATDADALYQLGLAYQADGKPEEALERYEKAVRLVPNFVEAYQGMSDSYAELGRPDHQAYAQGMIAISQQDIKSGLDLLQQATASLPEFAPAYLGLGLTYEQLGDLELARESLQHAIELDPQNFAVQHALGRVEAALATQN